MSGPTPDVHYLPTPPQRGRALPWIAGFALLAVMPVIILSIPSEISQWKLAAALEAWEQGDLSAGERFAAEAVQWNPRTQRLIDLAHVQQRMDARDYPGAWEKLEQVTGARRFYQQTELLLHLNRAPEALRLVDTDLTALRVAESEAFFEIVRKLQRKQLAHELNQRAYFRAVGNLELEQAKAQIDEALGYLPADVTDRSALLDTRGFIRWRMRDLEGALSDLDAAVVQAEAGLEKALSRKVVTWSPQGEARVDIFGRKSLTPAEIRRERERLERPVAVMRYHRGLAHQSRGDQTSAEKDFTRVRELGFEPGESLF